MPKAEDGGRNTFQTATLKIFWIRIENEKKKKIPVWLINNSTTF
jgi:hypothetical protein